MPPPFKKGDPVTLVVKEGDDEPVIVHTHIMLNDDEFCWLMGIDSKFCRLHGGAVPNIPGYYAAIHTKGYSDGRQARTAQAVKQRKPPGSY